MATTKAIKPDKPVPLATPTQPGPIQEPKTFFGGFALFLRQYNVIPLAIAVVIGNALNDVVQAFVKGIVSPLIALISPTTALQTYEVTVNKSTFQIGTVVNAVISFVVVALIVYVFVKKILHDESLLQKK